MLTCEARRGVCRMCYGRNLATNGMVDLGEADAMPSPARVPLQSWTSPEDLEDALYPLIPSLENIFLTIVEP